MNEQKERIIELVKELLPEHDIKIKRNFVSVDIESRDPEDTFYFTEVYMVDGKVSFFKYGSLWDIINTEKRVEVYFVTSYKEAIRLLEEAK